MSNIKLEKLAGRVSESSKSMLDAAFKKAEKSNTASQLYFYEELKSEIQLNQKLLDNIK